MSILEKVKRAKFSLPVVVIVAMLVFAPTQEAHAIAPLLIPAIIATGAAATYLLTTGAGDIVGFILGSAISWIVFVVNFIIALIFSFFIAILTWFTGLTLYLSDKITDSVAVKSGFAITLSVANLGFVLGIIVIAIATILRRESYGIKQILWKLVVAAILVNFSLVIGKTIISFANVATNHFMNSFPGGSTDKWTFAKEITASFTPQKFLSAKGLEKPNSTSTLSMTSEAAIKALQNSAKEAGHTVASITTTLLNLVFNIVFLAIITITLAALVVLLMVRLVTLGILLILMPLAWLMWIFPSFQYLWTKWWSNFLRWTFFAPIAIFFLFLAIETQKKMGTIEAIPIGGGAAFNDVSTGIGALVGSFVGEVLGAGAESFMVLGLALGGLFAANALSIHGASFAMGAAKGVGSWAGGKVWGKTKAVVGERVRTAGARRDASGRISTVWQRAGSKLQGVPLGGGLGRALAKWGQAEHPERAKEVAKYQEENLTPLTNEGIMAMAQRKTAFVDTTEAAAVASELAKRNLFTQLSPGDQKKYLEVAERSGSLQNILSNDPRLAAQTSLATPKEIIDPTTGAKRLETAAEAMARAIQEATRKIKSADVGKIAHEGLGNFRDPAAAPNQEQRIIALSLSNSQLGALGNSDDFRQIEAFRNTIRQLFDQHTSGAITLSPEELRQLQRIIDYTTQAPQWQNIV